MKRTKPPLSAYILWFAFLAAVCFLFGCTTVKAPDGTTTRTTDPKAVKVITKSAIEVATDLLDAYLRYIAPGPTQTLYDGPRVITSEVP